MTISAKQLGLTVTGTSAGEELILCPFHHDKNASAWWNPKKELFYCAVCGGFNLQQMAKKMHLSVEMYELQDAPIELQDYDLLVTENYIPRGERIYAEYYRNRGISESIIYLYDMEWRKDEPAAVLPRKDLHGERTGSVLRYIEPAKFGSRYKVFGETTPLWPMNTLRFLHKDQVVLVTEGAFSAMRLATYYSEQGVFEMPLALLGAKANEDIVDIMRPFRPVFLYDGDEAGRRACRKMRSLFPLALSFTLSTSPDDQDEAQLASMIDNLNERIKAQW